MQIDFQFYWENARTNMNRVMKLKPSVGCRGLLAAFIATLASVAQLYAADTAVYRSLGVIPVIFNTARRWA